MKYPQPHTLEINVHQMVVDSLQGVDNSEYNKRIDNAEQKSVNAVFDYMRNETFCASGFNTHHYALEFKRRVFAFSKNNSLIVMDYHHKDENFSHGEIKIYNQLAPATEIKTELEKRIQEALK